RSGDVIAEIAIQALPSSDFHHPADAVQTAAIGPPRARIEHQRHARQRRIAPGNLEIANDIQVPKRITEPGRMRQQVTQRYWPLGWAQLRNPFGVEAGENLG